MTPERWKQIDKLAQSALECGVAERAAFLDEACAGDDALRREVESQIAYQQQASKFLEEPAFKHAVELMADSQTETESMEGRTISHYGILRKLGAGGMGEVYLAQDTTLSRKVAIKFLLQHKVAGEQGKKRFVREAKAAAALDHPNICAVHEVGEEAGYSFIVMQFVEGETLASRMQRQPLEIGEALDMAVQVADALTEAHAHNIIHRDIKPSNIICTNRGQVKVLDFGLARIEIGGKSLTEEAETKSLLTEPGMIVGTAPYMSPEQVRGETVDARSDIFSFGAMFYEMLSGRQAFSRNSVAETINAILSSEPRDLFGGKNIPTELERIVRKCLAKDKERRYQTTRDLLIDTQTLQLALTSETPGRETTAVEAEAPRLPGPTTAQSPVSWRARLAGRRGVWLAMLLALLVAVPVFVYLWQRDNSAIGRFEIKSLAVLPLDNLSNDASQDYFADGMTDALITELAKIGTLRVISRSSTMLFKGKRKPMPEIARELNVDAVVEGSVLRSGDRVKIATQLFHAATGQNLWSESYERDLRDVLSLQSEVARGIVQEIKIKLTPQEDASLSRKRSVNPEAEEAYLRGLFAFNQGVDATTPAEKRVLHEKSFDHLQKAIKLDPNYAQAYATLALSYHWLASSTGFSEFYPKSKAAALTAIGIDDSNVDAHGALAFVAWNYEWDAALAEKEFKRVNALSRNVGFGGHGYALFLSNIGRHDEAIEQIRGAEAIDPLSRPLKANMVAIFMYARKFDHALEQIKRLLELNPNWWHVRDQLVGTYAFKGMYEEAIDEKLKTIELRKGNVDLLLAEINARAGRRIEATKILREVKKSPEVESRATNVASVHAVLGDKEEAFVWLEKAFAMRLQGLRTLKTAPGFDSLRSEPRFQEMLRRAGFPE